MKIVKDQEILIHSRAATSEYNKEQVREKVQVGLNEWKIKNATEGTQSLAQYLISKYGQDNVTESNDIFTVTVDEYELTINSQGIITNIELVSNNSFSVDFTCTKSVKSVELSAGTYKLEVWGAQGGSANVSAEGGLGGYSCGEITLTSPQTLYICVGEKGADITTYNATSPIAGGYNGGGSGGANGNTLWAPGGGATHIVKLNNRGELKEYASHTSEIIIVAGGGGGAGYWSNRYNDGGAGGGNSRRKWIRCI